VLAGLLGTVFGGTAMLLALSSDLFGRVPAMPEMLSAEAAQVAVVDGETLRLREVVVGLAGVTAPPRGQACGSGAASGTGGDCGAASSQALASLVRDRPVACRLLGRDSSGLARARCDAAGVDLNRAQVTAGWARARRDAPALLAEEALARDARRGIWQQGTAPSF
jgi:endonuclease YncB( thermonuclease family)